MSADMEKTTTESTGAASASTETVSSAGGGKRAGSSYSRNMHGRRQIFTDAMAVTDGNVIEELNKALTKHWVNRQEEIYLHKYLRGIQPILDRVKTVNAEINNKIVVNHANEIVTFKTANFAGEPIQYVSRGKDASIPEMIDRLNAMMLSEGKSSKDVELAYHMYTYGVAYRLVMNDKVTGYMDGDLFDEAPFEIYTPDPRNTFVVRVADVTKRVVFGVTYVYLDDNGDKRRYTVYTANATYTIEGSGGLADKITEKITHNFGAVTLVEYPCNTLYMGAFEPVLPLLDAINLTESNRLDGVEQFIQALVVFKGIDLTRDDFLKLKDIGAITLPPAITGGAQPDVEYLCEQLDQTQTQTLAEAMYQEVLQIVGMPSQGNANTSDSSNNGAVIMKNGWWNAEARALETEGMWREAETQFLKIVLKICRDADVKELETLKVSDVAVKFSRRSYQDLLVKTQSFTTLINAGCPPIQAFTLSELGTDPEALAIQYEAYQDAKADDLEAYAQTLADRQKAILSAAQTGGNSGNNGTGAAAGNGETAGNGENAA